jgi:hypothetical protein
VRPPAKQTFDEQVDAFRLIGRDAALQLLRVDGCDAREDELFDLGALLFDRGSRGLRAKRQRRER